MMVSVLLIAYGMMISLGNAWQLRRDVLKHQGFKAMQAELTGPYSEAKIRYFQDMGYGGGSVDGGTFRGEDGMQKYLAHVYLFRYHAAIAARGAGGAMPSFSIDLAYEALLADLTSVAGSFFIPVLIILISQVAIYPAEKRAGVLELLKTTKRGKYLAWAKMQAGAISAALLMAGHLFVKTAAFGMILGAWGDHRTAFHELYPQSHLSSSIAQVFMLVCMIHLVAGIAISWLTQYLSCRLRHAGLSLLLGLFLGFIVPLWIYLQVPQGAVLRRLLSLSVPVVAMLPHFNDPHVSLMGIKLPMLWLHFGMQVLSLVILGTALLLCERRQSIRRMSYA